MSSAEPTLPEFICVLRPDVFEVIGPDENGNYQFKGYPRTVLAEFIEERLDPDTGEITEVIVEREVVENTPLENIQGILDLVLLYQPSMQKLAVFKRVEAAKTFGQGIISEFATENIMLGITQAGKTTDVRRATADIMSALQTGSLYDAMEEIKRVPFEEKDDTFLTNDRLLKYLHRIEEYLDIPKTTSL